MSLNSQSINVKFGLLECLLYELEYSSYMLSAMYIYNRHNWQATVHMLTFVFIQATM